MGCAGTLILRPRVDTAKISSSLKRRLIQPRYALRRKAHHCSKRLTTTSHRVLAQPISCFKNKAWRPCCVEASASSTILGQAHSVTLPQAFLTREARVFPLYHFH